MLFLNPWLLIGLAGVLVPIILHLIRKQAAKPYDWGAMRFLMDTVVTRRRRMEWEELLLMAARCLLVALVALALARPLIPPDSKVPWLLVLPVLLLGIAIFGASFVLSKAKSRWFSRFVAVLMISLAGAAIYFEKQLNLDRFQTSSRRDIALIIDASTSMTMPRGGKTAFELAVDDAKKLVKEAPKGTAFSVILGGPSPEAKTATPLAHRADILEILENLRPIEGPFGAHDALGLATLNLAQGNEGAKDIIVFTDSQRVGWRLESPAAWKSLGEAWAGMPQKPRLMMRNYPLPEMVRNVTLSGLEFSRDVVGTDRELLITVKVENTGTEPITPGLVSIEIGGNELEPLAVGQLLPGQEEQVQFSHQFSEAGAQVVTAQVDAQDDLAADDRFERALVVRKTLPVLLVDGNPSGGFFDRATGYTAMALAPMDALLEGKGSEGKHLMDPAVIPATSLASAKIEDQAVIVLADVSRLPSGVAYRLAEFVARGGGLLILAGEKSDPDFYNSWTGSEGPVSPLIFEKLTVLEDSVYPASSTFDHPTLRLFKGDAGTDLEGAVVSAYMATKGVAAGGIPAAGFSDGSLFMASRNYGQGRVLAVTTGFDARLGNLPVRQSFVPLVHELVTWLGGGQELNLNVKATWSPSLQLSGGKGLLGKYFQKDGQNPKKLRLERVDSNIDFDWGNERPDEKLPPDNFSVTWTGGLIVPESGEYLFEGEVDDRLKVRIGDQQVCEASQQNKQSTSIELKKGEIHDIVVDYEDDYGEAFVRLFWKKPDGTRELIPSSAFIATSLVEGELVLAESTAIDPHGQTRVTTLTLGRSGKTLRIAGSAVPGPYLLQLDGTMEAALGSKKDTLPMVVEREVGESRLTVFNDDDYALIRKETDLVSAGSIQDILNVLTGKGFGKELWKILAIAAFVLLLLETALARWVSSSRKMSEEVSVDFEDSGKPNQEFMRELERVKKKA